MCITDLRFSATAAAAVTAAIIACTATATVTVAAEGYQKKYDDEKPDNIVVIENIAKTIHKISSLRRHGRRFHQSVNSIVKSVWLSLSVIIL